MLTYHRPASLAEACGLLGELGPDAMPLAGGTDIVPDIRRGTKTPDHLISLRDVPELRGIRVDCGSLRIGALTTPAEIAAAEPVRSVRPELLEAVANFGSPQIRSQATLGGNLCTAASCGDLAPLLMALGAKVVLAHPGGQRETPLEKFFTDVRATALGPSEIVVEVIVPPKGPGQGAHYEAFGLRAAAFITAAGVATVVRLEGENCRGARVVLSAVAPTPLLVPEAGSILSGRTFDDTAIAEAARAARDAASPISDIRGSAAHRKELVEVLTRRALRAAGEKAREDPS